MTTFSASMTSPASRAAPTTHLPLRGYVVVHAAFAIVALITSIVFQLMIIPTNWLLLLDAILICFLAAVAWIWVTMAEVDLQTTLVRLCVASCGLAAALVLFEQWFIHLTPLIVILPLMMATGELEIDRYRKLVRWAIVIIFLTTITARMFPRTPLYPLTTSDHRSMVALTFTPAFVAFIGWVAWRNHAALLTTTRRLESARQQLRLTETNVQNELRAKIAPVQRLARGAVDSVAVVRATWLDGELSPNYVQSRIAPIRTDLRAAISELRRISSKLGDDGSDLVAPAAARDAEPEAPEPAPIEDNPEPEPTLHVAVQMTIAFSLACFAAAALFFVFVDEFRTPLMLALLGVVLAAQIAPSLGARILVDSRPVAAVYLVTFALWVPPIIVGYYFSLVKAFFVPAMLIPIVISLPYLDRKRVGWLSAAASVAIAAMIAVARLTDEADEVNSSPELGTDLTVIVLLPLGTFIVLWLANRNHLALLARNRRLRRSQREVEQSYERVRSLLRRDLHDGSQQRLLTALLRLSIAEKSDPASGPENLAIAGDQLAQAASILATLKFGPNRPMAPVEFEAELDGLFSSGVSATIHRHNLPPMLTTRVVDAFWYICAEATTNTLKHAGPDTSITITLAGRPSGTVCLTFSDDGCGFDPSEPIEGTGLSNIRDRFDGEFEITSSPGGGTTMRGCIEPDPVGDHTPVIDLRGERARDRA